MLCECDVVMCVIFLNLNFIIQCVALFEIFSDCSNPSLANLGEVPCLLLNILSCGCDVDHCLSLLVLIKICECRVYKFRIIMAISANATLQMWTFLL